MHHASLHVQTNGQIQTLRNSIWVVIAAFRPANRLVSAYWFEDDHWTVNEIQDRFAARSEGRKHETIPFWFYHHSYQSRQPAKWLKTHRATRNPLVFVHLRLFACSPWVHYVEYTLETLIVVANLRVGLSAKIWPKKLAVEFIFISFVPWRNARGSCLIIYYNFVCIVYILLGTIDKSWI